MMGLSAWWSAWKYVAIAALLLGLSLWGNVHQYGTVRSAKAECRAQMEEVARRAVEAEFDRARAAEKRSRDIADKIKRAVEQERKRQKDNTNGRKQQIDDVRVTGSCVMPDGLPDLSPAVGEANAAGGTGLP